MLLFSATSFLSLIPLFSFGVQGAALPNPNPRRLAWPISHSKGGVRTKPAEGLEARQLFEETALRAKLRKRQVSPRNPFNLSPLDDAPPPGLMARDDSAGGSEPLNFTDLSTWSGLLSFGNPPQSFSFEIDTGSGPLILPIGALDASKSSSAKDTGKNFSIEYGSGKAEGELWQDTVGIGPGDSALKVDGQVFGNPKKVTEGGHIDANKGIAGFNRAKTPGEYEDGGETFFQHLCSAGVISPCQVSLYLSADENDQSELTFGPPDDSKFSGDITWSKEILYDDDFGSSLNVTWLINIGLGPTGKGSTSNFTGFVDTGAPATQLSSDQLITVFNAVDVGTEIEGNFMHGKWPCDSPPALSFYVNDVEFPIDSSRLNAAKDSSGNCTSSFFATSNIGDGIAVFGDDIISSAYLTFSHDKDAVGFAKLAK